MRLEFAAGLCLALLATGLVGTAGAATVLPQDVNISDGKVEQSLTGAPGDPEAGKKWFKDRRLGNCLACHANEDLASEAFHGELGPPLDGVAERYSAGELRAIIINSKAVFGTESIMPSFYRVIDGQRVLKDFQGKTVLSAEQVEDVVAYLMTLKE